MFKRVRRRKINANDVIECSNEKEENQYLERNLLINSKQDKIMEEHLLIGETAKSEQVQQETNKSIRVSDFAGEEDKRNTVRNDNTGRTRMLVNFVNGLDQSGNEMFEIEEQTARSFESYYHHRKGLFPVDVPVLSLDIPPSAPPPPP